MEAREIVAAPWMLPQHILILFEASRDPLRAELGEATAPQVPAAPWWVNSASEF